MGNCYNITHSCIPTILVEYCYEYLCEMTIVLCGKLKTHFRGTMNSQFASGKIAEVEEMETPMH